MANRRLIKFYKGVVLQKIHTHVNKDGATMSIDQLDMFLKDYSELSGSTLKMTLEEMKTLVEWSLYFANTIGCKVDYPTDKLDLQIQLNIK